MKVDESKCINMMILKEMNLEMSKLLKRISRSSKFPQVRNRAQCILLSYQGFSTEQLMAIFGISRRTLYNWLSRWKKVNLYQAPTKTKDRRRL